MIQREGGRRAQHARHGTRGAHGTCGTRAGGGEEEEEEEEAGGRRQEGGREEGREGWEAREAEGAALSFEPFQDPTKRRSD